MFMQNKKQAPKGIQKMDAAAPQMQVKHGGLNAFELFDPEKPEAKPIFKRDGFGWKPADLRLPPD